MMEVEQVTVVSMLAWQLLKGGIKTKLRKDQETKVAWTLNN